MAICGDRLKPLRPSREEVGEFLSGYGLAPPVGPVRMLRAGVDNCNLRVTARGEDLLLRRYGVTPPDEVRWELQVVARLGSAGFPTPGVLRRLDGSVIGQLQGRPAALFRFVRGVHPLRHALWAGEQVASALARLGTVTAGTARGRRSRTDLWRLQRVLDLAAPGGTTDPELPGLLAAVDRALISLRDHQEAWSDLPRGVIHHDARAANVLFDAQRRLVALLDFDEAYADWLLTGVARLLRIWGINHHGGGIPPARAVRLVMAYERERPLTPSERRWLPDFVLLTALADAAEYVAGRLEEDPQCRAVGDCRAWATYRRLSEDGRWRLALPAP